MSRWRSERWQRVARAGARELNLVRWAEKVDAAVKGYPKRFTSHAFDAVAEPSLKVSRAELLEGDVVLDAQMVLDLERALVEAQAIADEMRKLCDEELNQVRRDRLHRMINDATARVMHCIAQRGES